jgi:DNA modification methylase
MKYQLHIGDALQILKTMPDQSVNCWVTSPPYWGLRDYGVDGQLGLEKTPEEYVAKMVEIFREARRVLRDDGTLWLNLGDSYNNFRVSTPPQTVHNGEIRGKFKGRRPVSNSLKEKDLVGIPWMVAFALRADGWYLRQDIIWHKPNPMPESVKDRCTKAHEYLFLLSKSERYYFDQDAIKDPSSTTEEQANSKWKTRRELRGKGQKEGVYHGVKDSVPFGNWSPMRNKRSVWTIPTHPFPQAHFATFPPALVEPCILAGCPECGIVGDMFAGSGTTGEVALKHFRRFVGIELNPTYANEIAIPRIEAEACRHKQCGLFD